MSGRSDRCFGTPASAMTILLRGQARSEQFFGTLASATSLLLRGQTRSDRFFGTPASATTLLLCNTSKYTLVVFDMFRVFCKPNLTVA